MSHRHLLTAALSGALLAVSPGLSAKSADSPPSKESSDETESETENKPGEDGPTGSRSVGLVALGSDSRPSNVVVTSNQTTAAGDPTWQLGIGGYIRTGYESIENDPNTDFVGRNDGFSIADARLTLDGSLASGVGFRFQFDGAVVDDTEGANSPVGDVDMSLKDTFLYYQPFRFLRISAGQFKPPFDAEELRSNTDLLFVQESVGSRGVRGVEGYNEEGLSVSRQVGVRLDGKPWFPFSSGEKPTGLGFAAGFAATNGQTAQRSLNDNDKLAYYARGELHIANLEVGLFGPDLKLLERLVLGGAYAKNDRTLGERPNLVPVRTSSWTADASIRSLGFTLEGSITQQQSEPFHTKHPEARRTALAYRASAAWEDPWIGLQPTYRYAYYDPTSDYGGESPEGTFAHDTLRYHTVGLNYNSKELPLRLMVNYTFTEEDSQRSLKNNRLQALAQVAW